MSTILGDVANIATIVSFVITVVILYRTKG